MAQLPLQVDLNQGPYIWESKVLSTALHVWKCIVLPNDFYSIAPSGHHYALIQLKLC